MKIMLNLESKKRVGVFFQKKRLEKKFSQRDMAKSLGYNSPQFISNFERGIALLPTKKLLKYADKLELDKNVVLKLLMDEQRSTLKRVFKNSKV